MLAEITAGVSSLKTAFDITKGILDISNSADIKSAVTAIQQELINAQQSAIEANSREAALVKTIDKLEAQIAGFEAWDAEKQRHKLEQLPPGILMYGLRPGMENGEPSHKICANCYNQSVKSLLHITGQGNGLTSWKCHRCKFEEHTGHFVDPNRGGANEYY